MLVRSAARRQRRQTSSALFASFTQLKLPWLAPAQLRWAASQAPTPPSAPSRSRQRSPSTTPSPRSQSRHLATATDFSPTRSTYSVPTGYSSAFRNDNHDDHVPWDLSRAGGGSSRLPGLTPPHDPVILPAHLTTPPSRLKIFADYTGTITELLQHLHTSLLVGRVSRARSIVQRLAQQCSPDAPEALYAHSAFLDELLKALHVETKPHKIAAKLKEMQQHFEVDVRSRGTQPDTKILVVMIKASIKALDGSRLDRSIRRYMDIASEVSDDLHADVRSSEHYDDDEIAAVEHAFATRGRQRETRLPVEMEHAMTERALQNVQHEITPLATVPEVLATDLRGTGLLGVKRAMSVLSEGPMLAADASSEQRLAHAYERQRLLEDASLDIAMDRWRQADEDLRKIGISTSLQTRPMAALMWQWHQALLPALQQELSELKKMCSETNPSKEDERAAYGSYLELLPLDKVAAITILHVMATLTSHKKRDFDVVLATAAESLGLAIEQECVVEASSKMERAGGKKLSAAQSKRLKQSISRRVKRGKSASGYLAKSLDLPNEQILAQMAWPLLVHVKLGAMLISKLIETAQLPVTKTHPRTDEKVTQMQPAFMHRLKFERGNRQGIISPNPALTEKLESEPVAILLAKRMPMIVPPKPWTDFKDGGYLHYKNDIMRFKSGDRSGKLYFDAAKRNGDLSDVFAGLNALGQVPWRINQDVFKVQLDAWNSGEAIANFPPLEKSYEMPEQPSNMEDSAARRRWLAEVRALENKRMGLHSQRCFQNFQLEVARGSLNETLYFPHNMDFRGRAYPIPPYLNHMGADNVRGLLVFAEGKPLGEAGLRWLKIHLATVAGFDKASLEDRVKFVDDHLEDIRDSVRDPLGGRRWWLGTEDAWQVLAACFELTKALDLPDPTQYVSHLPIHQDGTCNGLQHYAALGGDSVGARQVNLEPGDRPSDIYTAVADKVQDEIRQDAESGNVIAQKLHGRITRKVVKQPVMTNVYGVTFFGARSQVRKQLALIFPEVGPHDEVNLGHLSHYTATKIFKSLGEMFTGAQAIQAWLGNSARIISSCVTPDQIEKLSPPPDAVKPSKASKLAKSSPTTPKTAKSIKDGRITQHFRSTVIWTTPLGLPVVQPYRKSASRVIKTNMAHMNLAEPQMWDPVSKRKQLQAFAPNFIHSLDSTHMLLSATKCTEAGLTFASIHDSFWSHACDVDTLSAVLRDAFIDMHSEDVVGRLRDEFVRRYEGSMYLAMVVQRSPLGRKIVEARKQHGFKQNDMAELALEAERIRLLKSADVEERTRGEAMVTPGSLWAAEGESESLQDADILSRQLGQLPEDLSSSSAEHEPEKDAAELAFDADEANEDSDVGADAEATTASKSARRAMMTYVWLPLQFPPVPPKGSFDVRRLRDSKYFFS